MKFRVIIADPMWAFDDKLTMSDVKRGAASNYPVLDVAGIKALQVEQLAEDDAVLALWVPCSILQDGLDVMKAWGFRQVQEWVWVKLTTDGGDTTSLRLSADGGLVLGRDALRRALDGKVRKSDVLQRSDDGDVVTRLPLAFGMGRLARASKEVLLIGARGRIYQHLKNRSQRDVFFAPAGKHSEKPEAPQDMLDLMFPEGNRLELFARRQRASALTWLCVGNEAPSTMGEDIRDTLNELARA